MTWWAQHGNTIGAAAAVTIVAGFGALTRYFSKLNDKKIEAAAAVPSPAVQAPPLASTTVLVAELEAARIARSGALLRIDELEEALRRQRRSIDELERENRQKSEALTEARALLEAANHETHELRLAIEGSRHGTEPRRSAHDPDRDRSRRQPLGGGWPLAREEVGAHGRDETRRKAPR
jgi:hypothetical protein